jgi:hypothetical protein
MSSKYNRKPGHSLTDLQYFSCFAEKHGDRGLTVNQRSTALVALYRLKSLIEGPTLATNQLGRQFR